MHELTPALRTWRAVLATAATVMLLLAVVAQAQASDETSTGFESSWPAPESCMSLASMASVTTDQDDYAPGSTVVVSGSGLGAGCDYGLQVVRPDGVVEKFAVASDADGNLTHEYLLPPPPGVIGEYRIDVVGLGDQVVASVGFMDAIAFENTGTNATTSGGQATLNIPKPTSTGIGDFLIAQVSAGGTDSGQHICPPAGWTSIRRTTQGSDVAIHTFYKFAASGDTPVANYTFTVRPNVSCTGTAQSRRMSGGIIRYTGVDTTTPVEAHSGNTGSSSTTLTASSVTASAGARVIGFYGLKKNTGLDPHAADGMTERLERFVSDGSGPSSMAADLDNSTAGATGNKRATTNVAEVWAAQLVSLKAAPSGPTKLAFTTPPRSGTVGQCLGPVTVQTQNASGAPTNVTSASQVGLATGGSGGFYGDAGCGTSISAANIATGANSATFYYTATARGTGSHMLTASATGLTSATQTQTIAQLAQTITFEAPADRTYGDADFDPEAGASSGLPVAYSSSTPGVCTITAAHEVRIVGAGTCTVTASQAGDMNHSAAADATRSFSVAPKQVTGSFTAEDKVYDGTTDAAISTRDLSGVVGDDDVQLSGGWASFEDRNVGQGKSVTATGFVLDGDEAGNYALVAGPWTALADITAKQVTGSFTAGDKVYDGDAGATIAGRSLAGAVEGDGVELSGGAAVFEDRNVGQDKAVTATGFVLAGAEKDNYALAGGPWTAQADITPKGLTGSFTADDKVYDGNAGATITARSLDGVIAGEDVELAGGSATFADAGVGQDKTVTGVGFALAGADKGNYELAESTLTTTASIVYATGLCLGAPGRTILQPINAAGTSIFKAGSTVPAKFRVCDASGNSVGTPDVVEDFRQIASRAGTVEEEANEEPVSTNPHTAFRWSEDDRQWIFNLNTKNLSAGKTYTYRISLADDTSIDFKFGLK